MFLSIANDFNGVKLTNLKRSLRGSSMRANRSVHLWHNSDHSSYVKKNIQFFAKNYCFIFTRPSTYTNVIINFVCSNFLFFYNFCFEKLLFIVYVYIMKTIQQSQWKHFQTNIPISKNKTFLWKKNQKNVMFIFVLKPVVPP